MCGCHSFLPRSAAPSGSVAMILIPGRAALSTWPAPVIVPPVPPIGTPADGKLWGKSDSREHNVAGTVPGVLRGIDLIALDGNPLGEIEAVRRVAFVMKGGKVFRDH